MGGPGAARRRMAKKCAAIKEMIAIKESNKNPKAGKNVTPRPRKKK
jgi:hypothetical protein